MLLEVCVGPFCHSHRMYLIALSLPIKPNGARQPDRRSIAQDGCVA